MSVAKMTTDIVNDGSCFAGFRLEAHFVFVSFPLQVVKLLPQLRLCIGQFCI